MPVGKLNRTLYLDFEWQSRLSLKNCGVHRVAEDPSTSVICAGWALVDHRVQHGVANNGQIFAWTRDAAMSGVLDLATRGARISNQFDQFKWHAVQSDTRVVAHSAEVEREVLRHKYGIVVPLARLSCTAARAARLSLPRSLEGIAAALGLDERKDMDGHKALMKLVRPRRPSRENRDEFWSETTKAEDFLKAYDYCTQDVRTMIEVDLSLPELPPTERALWELTVEMNERGFKVDLDAVAEAIRLAQDEEQSLVDAFYLLFGCSPGSPQKAAAVLGLPDVTKATVRDALKRPDLDPVIRQGCRIRQQYARASVKKLQAFTQRAGRDGRVRGSLNYSGAERTQRWSGSGVQPQNFPRGMGAKTDEAFIALEAGVLKEGYSDVLRVLSDMLKGFILGPFLVGDFATVEARVLAWFSGQENLLKLFRDGGDPYCDLATDIYDRLITKADVKQRFMGKQGVLSSGYGVGPDTFRALLDVQHDTQIDEETAKRVVFTYRRKYPRVPEFWSRMERALLYVVREKKRRVLASGEGLPKIYMGITEIYGRPFAYIELPSGRQLHYAYPEVVDQGGRDGENWWQVQFLGRGWNTRWTMVSTYGGKITADIVQSTARELMAEAMLRLRRLNFPLILTVHDEVVSEEPDWDPTQYDTKLMQFNKEMNALPEWAEGLPFRAECFQCARYRK